MFQFYATERQHINRSRQGHSERFIRRIYQRRPLHGQPLLLICSSSKAVRMNLFLQVEETVGKKPLIHSVINRQAEYLEIVFVEIHE